MGYARSIIAGSALLLSTSALAIPNYISETDGSGLNLYSDLAANGQGVYVWSNGSLDSWSIAWSAQTSGQIFDFFGSVRVSGNNLDSYTEVLFESGDGSVNGSISGVGDDSAQGTLTELVAWESGNNTHWDGINFTLSDPLSANESLTFELWTTQLSLSSADTTDVPATDIYISELFNTPDVDYIEAYGSYENDYSGLVGQTFVIRVPEPSIIALFGLGLIGIGVAARRRKA